jgi:hypothetical protein
VIIRLSTSIVPRICQRDAYLGIRHTVKRVTLEEPDDILFTEIAQPEGAEMIAAEEATAARLR